MTCWRLFGMDGLFRKPRWRAASTRCGPRLAIMEMSNGNVLAPNVHASHKFVDGDLQVIGGHRGMGAGHSQSEEGLQNSHELIFDAHGEDRVALGSLKMSLDRLLVTAAGAAGIYQHRAKTVFFHEVAFLSGKFHARVDDEDDRSPHIAGLGLFYFEHHRAGCRRNRVVLP